MPTKALAKIPSFIDTTSNVGKDDFDLNDLILPRILIAQKLSPQMDEDQAEAYIEGLKLGNIFNSVSRKIFKVKRKDGKVVTQLAFIVLKAMRPRYPIFDKSGKQTHYDVGANDRRAQWRGDKKPIASKTFDYMVYLPKTKEIAVLSIKCSNTRNLSTARRLNTLIVAAKGPIYSVWFKLGTDLEVDKKNRYYVWTISMAEEPKCYVQNQEIYEECETWHGRLKDSGRVRTDADADDDEDDDLEQGEDESTIDSDPESSDDEEGFDDDLGGEDSSDENQNEPSEESPKKPPDGGPGEDFDIEDDIPF